MIHAHTNAHTRGHMHNADTCMHACMHASIHTYKFNIFYYKHRNNIGVLGNIMNNIAASKQREKIPKNTDMPFHQIVN